MSGEGVESWRGEDDELLADVARRYYLDNTSKVDIAKQLGLSRF